jgi:hypothetical protein
VLASLAGWGQAQGDAPSFEIFCGYPAGVTFQRMWDTASAFKLFYAPSKTVDPDRWDDAQGTPCPPTRNATRLTDALADAFVWLTGLGLVDPGPERVGPVLPPSMSAPGPGGYIERVRVYLNEWPFPRTTDAEGNPIPPTPIEPYPFVGQVFGSSCTPGSGPMLSLPFVTFAGSRIARLNEPHLRSVAAHELVHVLQDGQALWRQRPNCDTVPLWISEGVAQAFAVKYARDRVPAVAPSIDDNAMLLGARDFRVPLVEGPEESTLPYDAHAFWRWLVETYGDDDYAFLANVVATPLPNPQAADWLAWLERGLTGTGWSVDRSLHLLFPQFLASHAEWGTSRWPHIGDARWRNTVYGGERTDAATAADGCEVVELSLAQPALTLLVSDLPALTARCFRVRMAGAGVAADQPITYWTRVLRPYVELTNPSSELDGLHLMFLEWGGDLRDYGGLARCHEEEAFYVPNRKDEPLKHLVPCAAKPYTSEQPTEVWMRKWETPVRRGGGWSDVLLLVRTPEHINDASQAASGTPSFLIEFSLDTQKMAVDGQPVPTQGGVNFRPPGFTRPPVLAEDGEPDFERFDPSLNMFGQQAPGGLTPQLAGLADGGIGNVLVAEIFDLDGDDIGRMFSFIPDGDAIPFGATGRFDNWGVEGVDPNHPMLLLGSDGPTASVTVYAWDDGGIHLAASGRWCYADERDRDGKCRITHTVEAEVWLAFGDTYDPDRAFVTRDTPVQALYRESFAGAVGFAGLDFDFEFDLDDFSAPPDGPAGPAPPRGSGGPSGGAGGSAGVGVTVPFVCACTCEVLDEIENLVIDPATPGMIGLVIEMGNCAIRCGDAFGACGD